MNTFAWFKNDISCKDLAYVDQQAEYNDSVNYLLVRRDLFEGTVEWKGMKTKDFKQTVRAFLILIKKNSPNKIKGCLGNKGFVQRQVCQKRS